MKIYSTKLGVICSFRYKREAIACLPGIARALGVKVWMKAPPGVMIADLPRGCSFESCRVAEDEDQHGTVTCIIVRP